MSYSETSDTTSAGPTWADPISGYFTQKDVSCMSWYVDLTSQADTASKAQEIYDKVSTGAMPLGEPAWSPEWVSNFQTWMNNGCP
ncbi:MAG: hypothetical protein JO083_00740 [Candidatus Eremiobacteraeota bacterium]|nr:hypothetical protein [Candidatus Eremiobacteraeota bacterium]